MPDTEKNFLYRKAVVYKSTAGSSLPANAIKCGTLAYSMPGLLATAFFLLLGGFGFGIILQTVYNLMPLQLKDNGASNSLIALLITTLPSMVTLISNPVFSTWSDQTRSRWGRRKPFLLISAFALAGIMIFAGWIPEITVLAGSDSTVCNLLLLGTASVIWNILFMIPNTTIWYLFPDTIPQKYIGTFMAFFNIISQAAGFLFGYCLLGFADRYMGWLYTGTSLFYLLSIICMCLGVKEGEYPPPAGNTGCGLSMATIKGYIRDCYSIPFYYWFFAAMALSDVSMVSRTMFNVLYARNTLQIPLERVGEITALGAGIGMAISIPLAWLSDKLNPMKFFLFSLFVVVIVNIAGFFLVHDERTFLVITIALAVVYTMQSVSTIPVFVTVLPKEQYGQFSSANALFRSVFMVLAGTGGGKLFDLLDNYQYIYAWDFAFTIAALACFAVLYKKWLALGGIRNYKAPTATVKYADAGENC